MTRAGPEEPPPLDSRVIVHEERGPRPGRVARVTPGGTRLGIILDKQGPDGQFTPSPLAFPLINADYLPSQGYYAVRGRARVEVVATVRPQLLRELRLGALAGDDAILRGHVLTFVEALAARGRYLTGDDTHSLNYLIRSERRDHGLEDADQTRPAPLLLYPEAR